MSFDYSSPPYGVNSFVEVSRELERLQEILQGALPRYEDLRFPAGGWSVPAAGAPDFDSTYGFPIFAIGEALFSQVQLPHSWYVGSSLHPHVHWMKTTAASGNVKWQLEYRWAKAGQAMDGSWTTIANETPSISDGDTAFQHAVTDLGDIDCSGDEDISDMLIMKISRVATTGASYGADAALLEFDLHYQVDGFGSEREYIKLGRDI